MQISRGKKRDRRNRKNGDKQLCAFGVHMCVSVSPKLIVKGRRRRGDGDKQAKRWGLEDCTRPAAKALVWSVDESSGFRGCC